MDRQKIAILVDSGSDVPPELQERYHIFTIPLKIIFNEAEYLDGLTIDAGEVYRRLAERDSQNLAAGRGHDYRCPGPHP